MAGHRPGRSVKIRFYDQQLPVPSSAASNNLALQYNHQINAISRIGKKNIWLGTDKGICIFNPYRQYFSTLSNQDTGRLSGRPMK